MTLEIIFHFPEEMLVIEGERVEKESRVGRNSGLTSRIIRFIVSTQTKMCSLFTLGSRYGQLLKVLIVDVVNYI